MATRAPKRPAQQPPVLEREVSEQRLDNNIKRARMARDEHYTQQLEQHGEDMDAGANYDNVDAHWHMFTVERMLRFHLCSGCAGRYFADTNKVTHLSGGFRMVSFVLCNSCTAGNNELKKAYKQQFPSEYSKGKGQQQQ